MKDLFSDRTPMTDGWPDGPGERVAFALPSAEILGKVFVHSNDAILVIDPAGDAIVEANPRACHVLGYDRDELLTLPVSAVHPHEMSLLRRFADSVFGQGHGWTDELTCLTKAGDVLPAEISASVVELAGRPCLIALVSDTFARRQAEEARRESDERFRIAFDHAAIGMTLVSLDGRWLRVNDAFCGIVGYREAELLATTFQAITHPDDLATSLTHLQGLLHGERRWCQFEKRYRHKEGHVVWVELSVAVVVDAAGRPGSFVTQIQDVTARKQTEAALAAESELLQTLMDHAPDFLYVKDASSRFVRMNRALARFLGVADPAEAVGKSDADFFPAALANEYLADEQRVVATGQPILNRLERQDATGNRWSLTSTVPVLDAEGNVARLIGVARDVTERLRVEEALRQSEARQRALLAAIPDLMIRFDRDGTCLDCQGQDIDQVLRPGEQVLGKPLAAVLPPLWTTSGRGTVVRAVDEGGVHVFEFDLHRDGPPRRVEARIVACGPDEAVMIARDVTERAAREARLAHQATHDPLTGLPNRALFADHLAAALDATRDGGSPVAVLFVDLDDFKSVNDAIGHEGGDCLLALVAERVRGCVRAQDTVARLAGDEFAVLLGGVADPNEANVVAMRIAECLAAPIAIEGSALTVSASVGIALGEGTWDGPEALLRRADEAMYTAKRQGKGRHAFFVARTGAAAYVRSNRRSITLRPNPERPATALGSSVSTRSRHGRERQSEAAIARGRRTVGRCSRGCRRRPS